MQLSLQSVQIAIDDEREALLVTIDATLVAVLVRLSNAYEDARLHGGWHLEAGFGKYDRKDVVFSSLDEAKRWFTGIEL
jgi:hypothetical protein